MIIVNCRPVDLWYYIFLSLVSTVDLSTVDHSIWKLSTVDLSTVDLWYLTYDNCQLSTVDHLPVASLDTNFYYFACDTFFTELASIWFYMIYVQRMNLIRRMKIFSELLIRILLLSPNFLPVLYIGLFSIFVSPVKHSDT